jgi:hypothetical protein
VAVVRIPCPESFSFSSFEEKLWNFIWRVSRKKRKI